MKFISTRASAPALSFKDALLQGLARDGGLYIPEKWPTLSPKSIRELAGKPYSEIAKAVLAPFIDGEIDEKIFSQMVDEAYATFRHDAVVPLVQIAPNHFILELFHGPTMAFKDVAMQLLSRLMDHVLEERKSRVTIIGATSGDTGGAAIEAFKGRHNAEIFILFPDGKVSDVQRRQMTTVADDNVHALAVDGTFDDCQALVKALFNDHKFADQVALAGVNSINWARIMAQVVYYFSSALALGAPERKTSFCVPTGNFGDIFAGYIAKRMGLPIEQLIIATNENDILERTLQTGRYEIKGVKATQSPSMDIQISSNFERLLFEAHNHDGEAIVALMNSLKQSHSFEIAPEPLEKIRKEFSVGRCDEKATEQTINEVYANNSYLLDPHSAVGVNVAQNFIGADTPVITLATAHPAKFPDAVKNASGHYPNLPKWQAHLLDGQEHFTPIENDETALKLLIKEIVLGK